MMLKPVRIIAPTQAVVSLAEAKAQLRVDHDDDDALIAAFVQAATDHVDGYTGILGRALLAQTWRQDFSGFGCLRLALTPVQSVSIAYVPPEGGAALALAGSIHVLREDALGPYVDLAPDASWPSVKAQADAVSVTAVCGYSSPGLVPEAIRLAVRMLAAHWYENREAAGADTMAAMPLAVDRLLAPWSRVGV